MDILLARIIWLRGAGVGGMTQCRSWDTTIQFLTSVWLHPAKKYGFWDPLAWSMVNSDDWPIMDAKGQLLTLIFLALSNPAA